MMLKSKGIQGVISSDTANSINFPTNREKTAMVTGKESDKKQVLKVIFSW